MASCKGCLHFEVCKDRLGTTKYYDNVIAADNVEKLCPNFKDRNRFVELPCKVGDTVYLILGVQNRILEFTVKEIRITSRFLQLIFTEGNTYSIWDYRFDLHFGKTVFLTREEAERALKNENRIVE